MSAAYLKSTCCTMTTGGGRPPQSGKEKVTTYRYIEGIYVEGGEVEEGVATGNNNWLLIA